MTAPVVVFAVGNPSRGDDAIGPLLIERLAVWLAAEGLSGEFELIEDFQLQIEHALDLEGRRLALFIDASLAGPAPYLFARIAAAADALHSTHTLSPAAVLHVYFQMHQTMPPPSFVLGVRGESFDLGSPLSPAALQHAEASWGLIRELCQERELATWVRKSQV